jgi:hypothetical protein
MVSKVFTFGKAKAPIFAAIAATGLFAYSCYQFVKKAPRVNIELMNAEHEKGEPLTNGEKAKIYAKVLWVPATTFLAASGLSIGSAVKTTSKIAKLTEGLATSTALYSAAQARIAEVEQKVAEHVKPETATKIREEIAEEHEKSETATTMTKDEARERLNPRHKYQWIEEYTGISFMASLVEVEKNILLFEELISKDGSAAIEEFLEFFPDQQVSEYPRSAEEYVWYDDRKAGGLNPDYILDTAGFFETGDPVIRIKWGRKPTHCSVINGVS